MCGICGIVTPDFRRRPTQLVKGRVSCLCHRGPEDFGLLEDKWVSLEHAQLSIIDLSTGIQPIHNQDQTLWIVCNGEAFNYVEPREKLRA